MLNENIKLLRSKKGLTQEELAVRMNVVRQTVSKWEKGLSVPDSEMLIRLADIFEVPVGSLLGETIAEDAENESEIARIAAKLEQLNALMAERNARTRTVMRIAAGCCIAVAAVILIAMLVPLIELLRITGNIGDAGIIGGADGPTAVFVTGAGADWTSLIFPIAAAAALAVVAVVLLRRCRKR